MYEYTEIGILSFYSRLYKNSYPILADMCENILQRLHIGYMLIKPSM